MPDELDLQPVFPLPNVVLFPRAVLPLHIFEPRYRSMIADVLDGGQSLVIALLKPGWEADYYGNPDVHSLGCVGRVIRHQKLPDGRYNVVLQGETKVLVDRYERRQPYRIARVHNVDEDRSWSAEANAASMAAQLVELYRRAHQRQGTALDLEHLLSAPASPEELVNTIAMNLDAEPAVRQQLLECDRLDLRYRAVEQILRDSSRTQDFIDRVRHLRPADPRRN